MIRLISVSLQVTEYVQLWLPSRGHVALRQKDEEKKLIESHCFLIDGNGA